MLPCTAPSVRPGLIARKSTRISFDELVIFGGVITQAVEMFPVKLFVGGRLKLSAIVME